MSQYVFRRWVTGNKIEDEATLENIMYNDQAGAQKNVVAGPALEYIGNTAVPMRITKGDQLYIFKTTAGVGYITLGDDNSIVAGSSPSADTFPVFGQLFTNYSADEYEWIVGSSAIHVYKMKDASGYRRNP